MSRQNRTRRVAREARRAGLYVLRGPGTLEFLSLKSGRRVALWIRRTGVILDGASNRIGRTASPFGAVGRAVELDRAARRGPGRSDAPSRAATRRRVANAGQRQGVKE
jgi:hypothetical protein